MCVSECKCGKYLYFVHARFISTTQPYFANEYALETKKNIFSEHRFHSPLIIFSEIRRKWWQHAISNEDKHLISFNETNQISLTYIWRWCGAHFIFGHFKRLVVSFWCMQITTPHSKTLFNTWKFTYLSKWLWQNRFCGCKVSHLTTQISLNMTIYMGPMAPRGTGAHSPRSFYSPFAGAVSSQPEAQIRAKANEQMKRSKTSIKRSNKKRAHTKYWYRRLCRNRNWNEWENDHPKHKYLLSFRTHSIAITISGAQIW